jgi:hypothetical protein
MLIYCIFNSFFLQPKTIKFETGQTERITVANIMRLIVTDELLAKFSWSGSVSPAILVIYPATMSKHPHNKLNGIIALIDFLGKRVPIRLSVIRAGIKNFFRQASERCRRAIMKCKYGYKKYIWILWIYIFYHLSYSSFQLHENRKKVQKTSPMITSDDDGWS